MVHNHWEQAKPTPTKENELIRLRKKLLMTRGRSTRITGAAYLLASGFFLLLAFLTRYILFEVISILAILLGVGFVLVGVESYVKAQVADGAIVSSLGPLTSLLDYLGAHSKAIHIPPTSEDRQSRIFLPRPGEISLPTLDEISNAAGMTVLEKGVLLPSIGDALLEIYEDDLGDLRTIDLDYLIAWLPRVLVDELKLAEKAEMSRKIDDIQLKMTNMVFRNVCQHPSAKAVCDTLGCPACSSIAQALSKSASRIVYYLKCENDPVTRLTGAFYRLGPTLEELR